MRVNVLNGTQLGSGRTKIAVIEAYHIHNSRSRKNGFAMVRDVLAYLLDVLQNAADKAGNKTETSAATTTASASSEAPAPPGNTAAVMVADDETRDLALLSVAVQVVILIPEVLLAPDLLRFHCVPIGWEDQMRMLHFAGYGYHVQSKPGRTAHKRKEDRHWCIHVDYEKRAIESLLHKLKVAVYTFPVNLRDLLVVDNRRTKTGHVVNGGNNAVSTFVARMCEHFNSTGVLPETSKQTECATLNATISAQLAVFESSAGVTFWYANDSKKRKTLPGAATPSNHFFDIISRLSFIQTFAMLGGNPAQQINDSDRRKTAGYRPHACRHIISIRHSPGVSVTRVFTRLREQPANSNNDNNDNADNKDSSTCMHPHMEYYVGCDGEYYTLFWHRNRGKSENIHSSAENLAMNMLLTCYFGAAFGINKCFRPVMILVDFNSSGCGAGGYVVYGGLICLKPDEQTTETIRQNIEGSRHSNYYMNSISVDPAYSTNLSKLNLDLVVSKTIRAQRGSFCSICTDKLLYDVYAEAGFGRFSLYVSKLITDLLLQMLRVSSMLHSRYGFCGTCGTNAPSSSSSATLIRLHDVLFCADDNNTSGEDKGENSNHTSSRMTLSGLALVNDAEHRQRNIERGIVATLFFTPLSGDRILTRCTCVSRNASGGTCLLSGVFRDLHNILKDVIQTPHQSDVLLFGSERREMLCNLRQFVGSYDTKFSSLMHCFSGERERVYGSLLRCATDSISADLSSM